MSMETNNQVLNLLANIINTNEKQILIEANYIESLQEKKVSDYIIEKQTFKLAEMINQHEQLETKFAELLQFLEGQTDKLKTMQQVVNISIEKVKSISLINKDAIYWREKATFYNATRKILFDELQKVKAENQQLKNGKTIQPG